MKKYIILIFILFLGPGLFAQSKSIYFNEGSETDDCIYQYSDPTLVTGDEWTLEAWFNADDVDGSAERHIFRFSGQLFIQNGVITGQAGYGASINAHQWYHIAYVRTASGVTVYLDGEVYASSTDVDDGAQKVVYLGAYNDYGSGHFSGKMDEFRLWNEARTQAQIQNNKDTELNGNETNLLIYYDFNDGSGNTTVADRAGGDDDGTLNNMEATDWTTENAPLPVELTTFTAAYNGEAVTLNWETATEVNNYGFEIERKPESGDWSKIAFVEGHGNSNSPKYYTFTDREIPKGVIKYRLKQIDIDGTFEYSDVVEITITVPQKYSLEANYPNPFNPTTNIRLSLPEAGFVKLEVFDILGKEVKSLISKNMEAGVYNINFNATNLKSGIYVYKLQTDNFVQVRKMMLLK